MLAARFLRKTTTSRSYQHALSVITLMLALMLTVHASAQNPRPLWLFEANGGNIDGGNPFGTVVFDNKGNLFGTTQTQDFDGNGMVYELTPTAQGLWKEAIIHEFSASGADGAKSDATLLRDSSGNLFGTTLYGGDMACGFGCGVVFELSPQSNGQWQYTVIHRFAGGADGGHPVAGVIEDALGNLYGTTTGDGLDNVGTVYELSPTAMGFNETVLHEFGGDDGVAPYAPLAFDAQGNLYGTALLGGELNLGTVYKLNKQSDGTWQVSVLHSFQGGSDGQNPLAGVTLDRRGGVFGASQSPSGALPCGTLFVLNPAKNYAETILHEFEGTFHNNDGCDPNQPVFDSHGNLFATTEFGGTDNAGTIFELSRTSSGLNYRILHSFVGDQLNSTDGEFPFTPMVFGPNGALFSTSLGPNFPAGGEVFEFIP